MKYNDTSKIQHYWIWGKLYRPNKMAYYKKSTFLFSCACFLVRVAHTHRLKWMSSYIFDILFYHTANRFVGVQDKSHLLFRRVYGSIFTAAYTAAAVYCSRIYGARGVKVTAL